MRGFTLVEMVLSVAIMAILIGLATPVYFSYQTNNEFGLATEAGVRSLRRAQLLAVNMEQDNNWGTYFSTSSITVYVGASFGSRNSNYDEPYSLPASVTSTVVDINFSKFTGEPVASTSITLSSDSGDRKIISVNAKGLVDY